VRKHSLGLPGVDCGFLLFCIHVGGGGGGGGGGGKKKIKKKRRKGKKKKDEIS